MSRFGGRDPFGRNPPGPVDPQSRMGTAGSYTVVDAEADRRRLDFAQRLVRSEKDLQAELDKTARQYRRINEELEKETKLLERRAKLQAEGAKAAADYSRAVLGLGGPGGAGGPAGGPQTLT